MFSDTKKSSSKRILIDARVACEKKGHGISRYVHTLISYFAKQHENSELHFIILTAQKSPFEKAQFPTSFEFCKMRTGWLSLLGQIELLWAIFKFKPHLFHAPSFVVPLLSSVPLVATIHDMNHVALSENYSLKQKIYYFFLKKRLLKARAVVTVSEFSKSEIVKYMNIPENLIHVIYNGISKEFKPKSHYSELQIQSVREKYSLPQNYIFSAGNPKAHKNLQQLAQAYFSGNFELPLVLLCQKMQSIVNLATKHSKQNEILFLSAIADEDLPVIYALCNVFIFPSLYEGFGFPPLEALACGVPVAASHTSCLPEVLENAALYFDPYKSEAIQTALHTILGMDQKNLDDMKERGFQIVQTFSIEQMAEKTLELYKIN